MITTTKVQQKNSVRNRVSLLLPFSVVFLQTAQLLTTTAAAWVSKPFSTCERLQHGERRATTEWGLLGVPKQQKFQQQLYANFAVISRASYRRTELLRLRSSEKDDASDEPANAGEEDDGEVGSGPNWIEKSFPVSTGEKIDPKRVDDYNLGIHGVSYDVGPLSKRMYDAILSRSKIARSKEGRTSPEIQRAFRLYAMDFTAKEAVRAALQQNGLEMILNEDDEQEEGMWADVDSIRLNDAEGKQIGPFYDSWEEAVDHWTPGQSFDFVARQVPAKMRELTVEEILQAIDPKGKLRAEAWEGKDEENDAFQ